MTTYTITLSDTEDKALHFVAMSAQDWIDNVVHDRCRIAIDEIVTLTVQKCLDTGTAIPGSKEEMVTLAFTKGWAKSSAQRQTEAEADMAAKNKT